jgi:hypothetical protein
MRRILTFAVAISFSIATSTFAQAEVTSDRQQMKVVNTITGSISPKSVLASNTGLVSAHNMMYRHSVTIYDSKTLELKTTVPDKVNLSDFGYSQYSGACKRTPVEGAFSPDNTRLYATLNLSGKVIA